MVDFARARAHMVDSQLRAGGVTNARILGRMAAVPREDFVPAARRQLAYIDDIQRLEAGRFMPPPVTLGKLLQLAEIGPDDHVLDIGAGSGYGTAVMAGLGASVIGLEAHAGLAETAAANLAALQLDNASVVSGAADQFGSDRFDVIIVQGALESVPDSFVKALRNGGRLVALIPAGGVPVAHLLVKTGSETTARAEFSAFLPLLFSNQAGDDFVF